MKKQNKNTYINNNNAMRFNRRFIFVGNTKAR